MEMIEALLAAFIVALFLAVLIYMAIPSKPKTQH